MSTDESKTSPFTEPWFVASAIVMGVLLVAAAVLVGLNVMGGGDASASPATSTSTQPTRGESTPEPTEDTGTEKTASVCGLDGVVLNGTLAAAPTVDEWKYEAATAYPTSAEYGPGAVAPEGYRYCFQHSPEGALYAAANFLAVPTEESLSSWVQYAASEGQHREDFTNVTDSQNGGTNGFRAEPRGFRMLSYTGDTARVDLAVNATTSNGPATVSAILELVWEDGDWKYNTDFAEPLAIAVLESTQSYSPWSVSQ